MTDPEKPLKEGYLLMPPKSSFILVSKPWQKKFCRLYCSSKQGIERLEIFENEDDLKNLSILTLENCIKICEDAVKNQNHAFAVVVTKTGTAHPNTHHFSSTSHDEMVDWISALQTVAFKNNDLETTIEEDNDLYCSSSDSGVYSVKLVASEATKRSGLEAGPYILAVTPSALQLHRMSDSQLVVTWPYRFIRKYGYHNGSYISGHRFTFEAGRSCSTGEGLFSFENSNQKEIFHCISSKMRHMKNVLTNSVGVEGGSQATLLGGDTIHFPAAMGMMARSRSPLPPSPTSSQNFESEFSSLGSFKPLGGVSCDNSPTDCPQRMFSSGVSSSSHMNSVSSSHISLLDRHSSSNSNEKRGASHERVLSRERSRSSGRSLSLERPRTLSLLPTSPPPPTERPPPPPPKPKLGAKPEKPPRKVLPCKTDLPGVPPPYDQVEVKSDAWRTQGLTSDFHSERPYVVPRAGDSLTRASPSDSQTKIFTVRTPESQKQLFINCTSSSTFHDYDMLQHLGTTSKVTSPGYRQVGPSLTLANRSKSSDALLQDNVIDTNKTDQPQLSLCSAKV
ncbi:hypothetical protein WDU94_013710 [Cyamophila willieti]